MIENKKKSSWRTWLIVVSIGLVLLYVNSLLKKDYPTDDAPEPNELLAYNYAEDFVKKNLKSPSSAKFPGISEKRRHTTDLGGGSYKIISWVDSQNSFGALIRTEFSCKIIFDGYNIRCEEMVFNE